MDVWMCEGLNSLLCRFVKKVLQEFAEFRLPFPVNEQASKKTNGDSKDCLVILF